MVKEGWRAEDELEAIENTDDESRLSTLSVKDLFSHLTFDDRSIFSLYTQVAMNHRTSA